MNKRKPRGPVPSLIGGANGKPKRVPVKKQSKCSRCYALFTVGETCVEIPKLQGAYRNVRRVCDECFQKILEKTAEDFAKVSAL